MKKLTNLDKKIEPFLDEHKDADKMPTLRYLIKAQLNAVRVKNNEESAEIGQILLKLKLVDADIDFENAEFKMIMDKFNENQGGMSAGFHSTVVLYLKAIESEKK